MPQLRIALAQIDPTVGDLAGNSELVIRWTTHAAESGAHLVAFPEMMLTGYPIEDLALRGSFVEASQRSINHLAGRLHDEGLGEVPVIVGYLDRRTDVDPQVGLPAGAPQNAAALLHRGRVQARYFKHHLPNYGVFDEYRYFLRGDRFPIFRLHGVDVAMAICEDLWQDGGPVAVAREAHVGLLVVINGSPYELNKEDVRLELAARRAREAGATLAFLNMVGGQDELVFDGDSMIVDRDGGVLARAPQFEETCLIADLELPEAGATEHRTDVDARDGTTMQVEPFVLSERSLAPYDPVPTPVAPRLDTLAEVYTALVTGTRDYVRKNGFQTAILQLSGGIDSALAATIAAEALGGDNVHAVLLPSPYSSEHSIEDAVDLARRQGIHYQIVSIGTMMEAFDKEVELTGVAAENLQARIRGMTAIGLANQHGHLVLATGNKSELATGYSTLYGDTVGGFAPIKDVLKTMVWELARWRNHAAERRGEVPPIPERSITKPPSAELRPGQLDEDSLPPYRVLDPLLHDYVEGDMGRDSLVAAGHDAELIERVVRLVDAAEWKRRQYPPGPKITLKAFGRDRRLPITNGWREPVVPR